MTDISLGIPLYNSSAFLDELFACLCTLDPLPREIVLLDDASRDDSHARASDFARGWSRATRLRVLRNEHNLGIAATLNRLASVTCGTWLQLLDADDYLPQADFYARIAPHLTDSNAVLVTALRSNAIVLDRAAGLAACWLPNRPAPWWPLLGSVATRSGVVYRREDVLRVPFRDPAFPGSDILHLLDLRLRGRCRFLSHAHVFYRIHAEAQSSQSRDMRSYRRALATYSPALRFAYALDARLRQFGQRLLR